MTSTSSSAARRSTRATARRSSRTSPSRTGGSSPSSRWRLVDEEVSPATARDRRRDGADALPGVRRPPRPLGALAVRRPAPAAEARAGLHDRGDLPRRPRARAGHPRSLARPTRLPARPRRAGPGRVGVGDGRGVPRRARRDATGDVPRRVGGARRDPRRRRRRSRRRPTASQLREMRAHVRAAIEAGARMLSFGLVYLPGRARGDRRARRRCRGGGRGRHPDRPARPERGRRAARGDRRDDRRREPRRCPAPHLASEGARRRADDPAASRAARRGEQ